jgi:hypothetical protein
MENISIIETNKISEKIKIILGQTDYSEEIALVKLKEFNFDEIKVIKAYLGITEKKDETIKSVNQEIFKQIRYRMDSNIREYKDRVEKGTAKNLL